MTNIGRQNKLFVVKGTRVVLEQIFVVSKDQCVRDLVAFLSMILGDRLVRFEGTMILQGFVAEVAIVFSPMTNQ